MVDGLGNAVSKIAAFLEKQDMDVAPLPCVPSEKVRMQRIALLAEENGELCKAIAAGNLLEVADGAGDVMFVAMATLLLHGIDPMEVLHIVCDSNLTKTKLNASDLKGGKGQGYTSPTEKLRRLVEFQCSPRLHIDTQNNKEEGNV